MKHKVSGVIKQLLIFNILIFSNCLIAQHQFDLYEGLMDLPVNMGQVADNDKDDFNYYSKNVNEAMSKSYIVDYNKYQYQDQIKKTELKQELFNANGEPYSYLDALKEVQKSAMEKAYAVSTKEASLDENGLQNWGKYEPVKQKAIQRIEQYRKGNVRLKVKLPNDQIASNIRIQAKLKRHTFKWGAVVKQSFATSSYSEKYKEIFLKYFNATGFSVALKPKFRNSTREKQAANVSLPWFLENDFYVRGHTLVWEGFNFMRPEDKAIYKDPTLTDKEKGIKLLESCSKHFYHAIDKWDVACWDVSNEPIVNNIINNLLPNMDTHVYWFKLADSLRTVYGKKDIVLFQNDYQIISGIAPWVLNYKKEGYKGTGRLAIYKETLEKQIAAGAPIEGIGFQSRIKLGLITPDTIYKRLCDFDKFNLPYQATEFEIRDDAKKYVYTDEERRLVTEYMIIMYFSHPKVNGFWHWTFADGANENLNYPLFNYDGTPKVNGEKWMELMDGFLTTNEVVKTNRSGEADLRGYYGKYEVETEVEGEKYMGKFMIAPDNKDNIEVSLERKY